MKLHSITFSGSFFGLHMQVDAQIVHNFNKCQYKRVFKEVKGLDNVDNVLCFCTTLLHRKLYSLGKFKV